MLKKKNNLLHLYADEVRQEVVERLSWERRRRRQARLKFFSFAVWLLVALIALVALNLAALYPDARDGYRAALAAKNDLAQAQLSMAANDNRSAGQQLAAATTELDKAIRGLKKIQYSPVGWLPVVRQHLSDSEKLLVSGKLAVAAIQNAYVSGQPLFRLLPGAKSLNFSKMSKEQKMEVLASVADGRQFLPELKSNLTSARDLLKSIEDPGFFLSYGLKVDELIIRLDQGMALIDRAQPLSLLLPALAGHGKAASYLLLFENRHELRPTGGFIGSYGLGLVSEGQVERMETRDVYALDWPVKDKFSQEPPPPIKKYLGQSKWFFRDANWNPDWPQTAQQLVSFYQQENKLQAKPDEQQDFDFVIALTPDVIVDFINLTGPVTVQGQTYNGQNFIDLLQQNTELDYAKFGYSRLDRKAILGDIAKELQNRILNNLDKLWQPSLNILTENLTKKNMLVWAKDKEVAGYFDEQAWDGRMEQTDGDYTMLVDANLHGLKTDAVISRQISYQVTENNTGLVAKFEVKYAHSGLTDWKTDKYNTYTRLYVPKGSKLISLTGASSTVDTVEENNKTYFGAFLSIEPGKIGGLSFEYELPYNLKDRLSSKGYSLWLQKQPGTISDLSVNLSFLRPIRRFQPANLVSYRQGSQVWWQDRFAQDKYYQVNF